jgi:hypothetical protein
MAKRDRVFAVERAIWALGLESIRDARVGTVERRGISGGQRKRVNVGLEMVAEPSLLILDGTGIPMLFYCCTHSQNISVRMNFCLKARIKHILAFEWIEEWGRYGKRNPCLCLVSEDVICKPAFLTSGLTSSVSQRGSLHQSRCFPTEQTAGPAC